MRASLPPDGYRRPETLTEDERGIVVDVRAEAGRLSKTFLFSRLRLPRDLTMSLAIGFAAATGPGGTIRTLSSAEALFTRTQAFARHLDSFPSRPSRVQDLTRAHISELRLRGSRGSEQIINALRRCLRSDPDLAEDFRQLLFAPLKASGSSKAVAGYSQAEFRQIRRAARTKVRIALQRTRALQEELDHWRASSDTENLRGVLLDYIDRHGSVPRYANGTVKINGQYAGSMALMEAFYPSADEVCAAAMLLICLTGLNLSTVCTLTDEYTRADAQLDPADPSADASTRVIITRSTKLRRGLRDADQDATLTSTALDDETSAELASASTRQGLGSPFDAYLAIEELCRSARRRTGTQSLLCFFSGYRLAKTASGLGFRAFQAAHLSTWKVDIGGSSQQKVDSRRLRRTFLELTQKPVDHKASTLTEVYLGRDRAALHENQTVIRDVLEREANRLRATHAVQFLSEQDLREASRDPEPLALRLGISTPVLVDMLAGRLDTVATACVDNTHSPYDSSGSPCTASFMLCLGCPCARSEPRHIPVQAALTLQLEERRLQMDDAQWDSQFGAAHSRLIDLLGEQKADLHLAAKAATPEQLKAITALVEGNLDLR